MRGVKWRRQKNKKTIKDTFGLAVTGELCALMPWAAVACLEEDEGGACEGRHSPLDSLLWLHPRKFLVTFFSFSMQERGRGEGERRGGGERHTRIKHSLSSLTAIIQV